MSLTGSTTLGGIVVEIRGNLSPLRSDIGEAKNFAARAEREIKIKVPMVLDPSRLLSDLRAATATAQSQVKPLVIPVVMGGGGMRMLPGPAGGGGGAITGSGGTGSGYSISSGMGAGWQGGAMGSAGTWQTGVGRSAMGGGSSGPGFWNRPMGPLGAIIGMGAVNAGLHGAATYAEMSARQPGDTAEMLALRGSMGKQAAWSGIPFVGGAVDFAYGMSGYGQQMTRDMTAMKATQSAGAAGQAFASTRFAAAGVELAGLRGDPEAAIRKSGADRVIEIENARKAEWQATGDKTSQVAARDFRDKTRQQVAQETAITSQQLADLNERRVGARDSEGSRYAVSKYSRLGIEAMGRGDSTDALVQNLQAGREGIIGAGNAKLVGVKDQALRQSIMAANTEELSSYDANSNYQMDRKRVGQGVDALTAAGSTREAGLRAARKDYEADLEAFDTAQKAKIALIEDVQEKQNEATRGAAQRSIMVSRHEQMVADAKATNNAAGIGALLRTDGRYRLAARAEFDEFATAELQRTPEDLKDSVSLRQDRQRRELIRNQNLARADIGDSLKARAFGAMASADGMNRLGGLYATLAGQRSELRHADAEDRGQIRSTQLIELQSMRRRLTEGSRDTRAMEFDARRMAGSDDASKAAREQVEMLKAINAGIQKLVEKDDGGAVAA